MKNLGKVLREKEKQVVDLQQEIEILRNAGQILGAPVGSSRTNLNRNKISQVQMIRAVLLEHDRPLHADELRKEIKERFGTPLKNHDITSVIYRAIRGGAFFRKEGVNTFGLLEWKGRRGTKIRKSALLADDRKT
jgi:repressor of nif and glnA expression